MEQFLSDLAQITVNVKTALVGKDAVLVGLSNSLFQDIIYRAKTHPKRNVSSLNNTEKVQLYNAIKIVIQERLRQGGKNQFIDLYGKQGRYVAAMGPNMKDQNCPECNCRIQKIAHGGVQVFLCPTCQK